MDDNVKKVWNLRDTVSTNMAALGLNSRPNDNVIHNTTSSVSQTASSSDAVEILSVTDVLSGKVNFDKSSDDKGTAAISEQTLKEQKERDDKFNKLFNIPQSGIIPKKTKAAIMLPISVENQKYVLKLLQKHVSSDEISSETYQTMAYDIKLNNMQHTTKQLKKLVNTFLNLKPGQCVVEDIPENVKSLMKHL